MGAKLLATLTPTAASNVSFTSWATVPQEGYNWFAIIPPSMMITATAGIRWQGAMTSTGATGAGSAFNFLAPMYGAVMTSVSGTYYMDEIPGLCANSGGVFPIQVPGCAPYIRAAFMATCTANTSIYIYGRLGPVGG